MKRSAKNIFGLVLAFAFLFLSFSPVFAQATPINITVTSGGQPVRDAVVNYVCSSWTGMRTATTDSTGVATFFRPAGDNCEGTASYGGRSRNWEISADHPSNLTVAVDESSGSTVTSRPSSAVTGSNIFYINNPFSNNSIALPDLIAGLLDTVFTLAGVIALIFLVVAGFKYVTSSGNAEAAEAAKVGITNAIIGLIIIFAATLIVNFTLKKLGVRDNYYLGIGESGSTANTNTNP